MGTQERTNDDAVQRGMNAAEARFEKCGRDIDAFEADLLPDVPRPLEGDQLGQWLAAFDGVPPEGDADRDTFIQGLGMGATSIIDRERPE